MLRRSTKAALGAAAAGVASLATLAGMATASGPAGQIELTLLDRFEGTGAEIPAFDTKSRLIFVTDAEGQKVDVLALNGAGTPSPVDSLDVAADSGDPDASPNSVAAYRGLIAVAVEAGEKTDPGWVLLYRSDGTLLKSFVVGSLPDMVTFTPDGRYVLVANEGEPSDDYETDPEGSVSVIDLKGPLSKVDQSDVRTADFDELDAGDIADGVRIFGLNDPTAAEDFEPEYIAVSKSSRTAWVTLQENNAVAILDVKDAEWESVEALGYKNHNVAGAGLDPTDEDGPGGDPIAKIDPWPVLGMYQPDAIAATTFRGRTFLVTANEGDAREYVVEENGEEVEVLVEEVDVADIDLDPTAFPNRDDLQQDEQLGKLNVTNTQGDTDGDGDFDRLYSFGARSFSVWSASGELVFDSGDAFEQITKQALEAAELFNAEEGDTGEFDGRSDNKGPEPEGLVLGEVKGKTYAFICLERAGGIMVYDVSDPRNPQFVDYVTEYPEDVTDKAPESLAFVPKSNSPTGSPLLVVANEVSGTTAIYEIASS